MIQVMQSINKSILFTRSSVGIGSREHDLIGEDKIKFLTSSFDSVLNTERAFPLKGVSQKDCNELLAVKLDLILEIFEEKKSLKMFGNESKGILLGKIDVFFLS